jgi:hypothetical protein
VAQWVGVVWIPGEREARSGEWEECLLAPQPGVAALQVAALTVAAL